MGGIDKAMLLAIIAIVIAVIAILLAVFFYLKIKLYLTDDEITDNYVQRPKRFRDLIVASVVDSSRVKDYFYGVCREFSAKSRNGIKQADEGISTAMYNDIVENVVRQVRKQMSLGSTPSSAATRPCNSTKQVLYASSYNQVESTFYEVGSQPSDLTIFEITLNPSNSNEGTFEVYHAAYDKVVGCKDFLEFCCEVEGSGNNLQTITSGMVICRGGVWSVENKLKIRFC